ncbi:MAG: hypothetical protein IT286_03540 [Proteobacteria bacterium]|jgi:hypothetical protein|nr:hypothetical protein [Pseudomonadota bacterium]
MKSWIVSFFTVLTVFSASAAEPLNFCTFKIENVHHEKHSSGLIEVAVDYCLSDLEDRFDIDKSAKMNCAYSILGKTRFDLNTGKTSILEKHEVRRINKILSFDECRMDITYELSQIFEFKGYAVLPDSFVFVTTVPQRGSKLNKSLNMTTVHYKK